MSDKCELCDMGKRGWYADNDIWVIRTCRACKTPMAVFKAHGKIPTPEELQEVHRIIETKIFASRIVSYEYEQFHAESHYHMHILLEEEEA